MGIIRDRYDRLRRRVSRIDAIVLRTRSHSGYARHGVRGELSLLSSLHQRKGVEMCTFGIPCSLSISSASSASNRDVVRVSTRSAAINRQDLRANCGYSSRFRLTVTESIDRHSLFGWSLYRCVHQRRGAINFEMQTLVGRNPFYVSARKAFPFSRDSPIFPDAFRANIGAHCIAGRS